MQLETVGRLCTFELHAIEAPLPQKRFGLSTHRELNDEPTFFCHPSISL
jgi:hypothetical protein